MQTLQNYNEFILFLGRDVSVTLQPADIVTKLRKGLKSVKSYKEYLLNWSHTNWIGKPTDLCCQQIWTLNFIESQKLAIKKRISTLLSIYYERMKYIFLCLRSNSSTTYHSWIHYMSIFTLVFTLQFLRCLIHVGVIVFIDI